MQAEDDTKLCQKCGAYVFSKAYQIHKIMCNKREGSKVKKKQQSSNPFKKIIDFFTGEDEPKKKQTNQALIPCLQCGESFSFSQYAVHQQQCVGHQLQKCQGCGLKYPEFLIEEHLNYCEGEQPQFKYVQYQEEDNAELEHLIGLLATEKISSNLDCETGLTQQQISTLKAGILKEPEDCPICCTPMTMAKRLIRLNCSHIYHHGCASAWLKKQPLCPMCRTHALKM